MKTNKKRFANYLKLGILLFGISVLLWNCEKENYIIEPEIAAHQFQSKSKTFSKVTANEISEIISPLNQKFQSLRHKSSKTNVIDFLDYQKILKVENSKNNTAYSIRSSIFKDKFINVVATVDNNNTVTYSVYEYVPYPSFLRLYKLGLKSFKEFRGELYIYTLEEYLQSNSKSRSGSCPDGIFDDPTFPDSPDSPDDNIATDTSYDCEIKIEYNKTCDSGGSNPHPPELCGYGTGAPYYNVEWDCTTNTSQKNVKSRSIECTNGVNTTPPNPDFSIGINEPRITPCENNDCTVEIITFLSTTLELNQEEKNWVSNPNNLPKVLKIWEFIQANSSLNSLAYAKESTAIFTELDALNKTIEAPTFDALNNPWLKILRELAKRIEQLKESGNIVWEALNQQLDTELVNSLNSTARRLFPEVDNIQDETAKQNIFKTDGKKAVAILLYEFANGLGKDLRTFTLDHNITHQMLSGNVTNDIKADFNNVLNKEGITFEQFKARNKSLGGGYAFSPDHTGVVDSFNKHINANWVQFFVGGTSTKYYPSNEPDWIIVEMTNPTSRNSLLLHIGDEYKRDGTNSGDNKPLSTINQIFRFKLKIP